MNFVYCRSKIQSTKITCQNQTKLLSVTFDYIFFPHYFSVLLFTTYFSPITCLFILLVKIKVVLFTFSSLVLFSVLQAKYWKILLLLSDMRCWIATNCAGTMLLKFTYSLWGPQMVGQVPEFTLPTWVAYARTMGALLTLMFLIQPTYFSLTAPPRRLDTNGCDPRKSGFLVSVDVAPILPDTGSVVRPSTTRMAIFLFLITWRKRNMILLHKINLQC